MVNVAARCRGSLDGLPLGHGLFCAMMILLLIGQPPDLLPLVPTATGSCPLPTDSEREEAASEPEVIATKRSQRRSAFLASVTAGPLAFARGWYVPNCISRSAAMPVPCEGFRAPLRC
jgi:hypothetical protein